MTLSIQCIYLFFAFNIVSFLIDMLRFLEKQYSTVADLFISFVDDCNGIFIKTQPMVRAHPCSTVINIHTKKPPIATYHRLVIVYLTIAASLCILLKLNLLQNGLPF